MKVKPVIYSMKPKYPDKYSVDIRHEVINNKPLRWMNKPLTLSALSASILFSSCLNNLGTTESTVNNITNIPIFSHGEGTGSIGCVSILAPMFLTEEEAYTVISQELKIAGVTISKNDKPSSGVNVPLTKTYYNPGEEDDNFKTTLKDFTYDASANVESNNINIEFVSVEDYKEWQDPNQKIWSSVEALDIKDAAESLANENKMVAAFYDPFTYYKVSDFEVKEIKTYDDSVEAHDASVEFLRAQVKDFIEWLKAEGVI